MSCFPKQVHVAVGMIAFITLLIDAAGENFLKLINQHEMDKHKPSFTTQNAFLRDNTHANGWE